METRRERIEVAACKAIILGGLAFGAWFVVLIATFLSGAPA